MTTAGPGNLVQTGLTSLTGRPGRRELTLALGFGRGEPGAADAARGSLDAGFHRVARRYQHGWHDYLSTLRRPPAASRRHRTLYSVSAMVLAALEDKTFVGASVASPSMPWAWGDGETENPSGPYHLVWARDLYQVATAQLVAGDRPAAVRLLRYLFERQQKPDGSFPQNSEVDGTQRWENLQLDEVGLPLLLAWQLRAFDPATWRDHVKPAADFLLANGPVSPQERWENQSGYSPATIAAEVAGLVAAADIARRNGDAAVRRALPGHRRRLARARGRLDGHHERPTVEPALLPARDQGRTAERSHHLCHRRQRAVERGPAPCGGPELP